jgi:hypothetical protein
MAGVDRLLHIALGAGLLAGSLGAADAAPRGASHPAPAAQAASPLAAATQLVNAGKYTQALAVIDDGLGKQPNDLLLLQLKGSVMIELRDVDGAIAAFQAYIAAGARGTNKREAEKIVQNLSAAPLVDITLSSGSADIYLDSKSLGVLCNAAPTCSKKIMPGAHKILVERPGYQPVAQRVDLQGGKPVQVAVAMTELPSMLTLRLAQSDAHATIDDAPYAGPVQLPAGPHRVVVSLAGHTDAHLDAVAHEGKPVELDVALTPLVPIHVQPATASLTLDGAPVVAQADGLAVPPGAHHLVIRAPGYRDRAADLPAELPANYSVDVTLDHLPPPSAVQSSGLLSTRRAVAIGFGGLAVAGLATGLVLGKQSRDADHNASSLCPSPTTPCAGALQADSLNQHARDRATQANIAFGVAGAGAVAAAVLWMIGAPESRVVVAPQVGAVAGLDLGVRF